MDFPQFVSLLAPLTVLTLYLYLSRGPLAWVPNEADWIFLILAVASGAVPVVLMPLRPWPKAIIAAAYIPAMSLSLILWGLVFVCAAFGDCL